MQTTSFANGLYRDLLYFEKAKKEAEAEANAQRIQKAEVVELENNKEQHDKNVAAALEHFAKKQAGLLSFTLFLYLTQDLPYA